LRYLFEDYAFDTDRRELHRGADVVSVAPQVFDLLDYLIRNRERVVSKDDLIKAIWNGRSVSDAALTTRLNACRSAISDSGEEQRLIKTLPRKGFRFVGTVREAQRPVIAPVGSAQSGQTAQTSPSPPRLSIVVLPFANLSSDPEQDYFIDGVTENLTTDLSRIDGLFVIARNSAFSYKGKAIDVRQVAHELNVRYVLEGSMQRSGKRLRVKVQHRCRKPQTSLGRALRQACRRSFRYAGRNRIEAGPLVRCPTHCSRGTTSGALVSSRCNRPVLSGYCPLL